MNKQEYIATLEELNLPKNDKGFVPLENCQMMNCNRKLVENPTRTD